MFTLRKCFDAILTTHSCTMLSMYNNENNPNFNKFNVQNISFEKCDDNINIKFVIKNNNDSVENIIIDLNSFTIEDHGYQLTLKIIDYEYNNTYCPRFLLKDNNYNTTNMYFIFHKKLDV